MPNRGPLPPVPPVPPHPLAAAAGRAAYAAGARARELAEELALLRAGVTVSVADTLDGLSELELARGRRHEAERRLVTLRIARANQAVLGEDVLAAARRIAARTLSEEVRRTPLER